MGGVYGGGGIEGMSLMLLLHTEEKQTCKCLENCEGDAAVSGSGIKHENVIVCALLSRLRRCRVKSS